MTLADLVDAQAARTPDAVAVLGDEPLTYRELAEWSAAVADRVSGDVVAVEIPRSVELVVALLGVLRAGAAYLPVDPGYPADRRDFMRTDAGRGDHADRRRRPGRPRRGRPRATVTGHARAIPRT